MNEPLNPDLHQTVMPSIARQDDYGHTSIWHYPALLAIGLVIGILALYHETATSMVSTWISTETYAHGFLILPITAYLIWMKRKALAVLAPAPAYGALALLFLFGFIWEIGYLARVVVVQQYTFIAMLITAIWATLGTQLLRAMLFPMLFLFFAVPFGEILIPYLIDFTANFTVRALQITGVPVYREGAFFSIPTGNWSVVDACSGLRYLIASVTLGCLYAYLTYRSNIRRSVFIVLSIIVPIIANGLRAYMIVMIGHLSGMRLALGVDHYIYGWVFFGLVMFALFWLGSLWRENQTAQEKTERTLPKLEPMPYRKITMSALAVFCVTATWPIYAAYIQRTVSYQSGDMKLTAPLGVAGWQAVPGELANWQPHYLGYKAKLNQVYVLGDKPVELYIRYYKQQQQGSELIHSQNVMVSPIFLTWSNIGEQSISTNLGNREIGVQETRMLSGSNRVIAWHAYWLNGQYTSDPYVAKWLDAKSRLLGHNDDAAIVIVAAKYDEDPNEARSSLNRFFREMGPKIEASLLDSRQQSSAAAR